MERAGQPAQHLATTPRAVVCCPVAMGAGAVFTMRKLRPVGSPAFVCFAKASAVKSTAGPAE
eukprot:11201386-Lingulodinium_polyedra.AAC.1